MDLSRTQPLPKPPNRAPLPPNAQDDRKELAWAFLGLILWSGVVLGALFGLGYVLGHSILRLW